MFLSVTSSFHSGAVKHNGFSVLYSDTAKCVCREKSEEIALLLTETFMVKCRPFAVV